MEIQVAEHAHSALRCAVCHDDLGYFKSVCPGCGTHLHFSCRTTLRRCPTIGCDTTWETSHAGPPPVRARLRQATLGLALGAFVDGLIDRVRPGVTRVRHGLDRARSPRSRRQLRFLLPLVVVGACALVTLTQVLPPSRHQDTQQVWSDLLSLESAVHLYRLNTGRHPSHVADLLAKPSNVTGWRGPYLADDPVDPWGNPYVFRHHAGRVYELLSYGPDGLPGGTGADTDVVLRRGFEPGYRADDTIDLNLGVAPAPYLLQTDSGASYRVERADELEDRPASSFDYAPSQDDLDRRLPLKWLCADLVPPHSVDDGD